MRFAAVHTGRDGFGPSLPVFVRAVGAVPGNRSSSLCVGRKRRTIGSCIVRMPWRTECRIVCGRSGGWLPYPSCRRSKPPVSVMDFSERVSRLATAFVAAKGELRPSVRFFRLLQRRAANVARAKCCRGGRCRRFGRTRCPESSTRMRSLLFCPARRALPAAAGPVTRRGRFVRDSKRICLGGPKNLPRPAFRGSGTEVPCPVVVVRRCKKRCSVIYIR